MTSAHHQPQGRSDFWTRFLTSYFPGVPLAPAVRFSFFASLLGTQPLLSVPPKRGSFLLDVHYWSAVCPGFWRPFPCALIH